MSWQLYIMLLWLHLLPLMPFARIHRTQIKTANQRRSIWQRVLHTLRAAPLPRACTNLEQTHWWTCKQPMNNQAMRKLPIPPLSTTAYTTKTSKQKKTNEEKQAKKKELDQAALRGGALEASWSAAVMEGEGPGSFQAKSTLFSILPTSALRHIKIVFL